MYDIGADDAHTGPVHATLEALRDRSIAVRASQVEVPDLAVAVALLVLFLLSAWRVFRAGWRSYRGSAGDP